MPFSHSGHVDDDDEDRRTFRICSSTSWSSSWLRRWTRYLMSSWSRWQTTACTSRAVVRLCFGKNATAKGVDKEATADITIMRNQEYQWTSMTGPRLTPPQRALSRGTTTKWRKCGRRYIRHGHLHKMGILPCSTYERSFGLILSMWNKLTSVRVRGQCDSLQQNKWNYAGDSDVHWGKSMV